ncbi:MAG: hypothetical protein KA414_09290, partial [Limnohabitans sp.]|nr:hypothetical protein [Limnohabitans sp.]
FVILGLTRDPSVHHHGCRIKSGMTDPYVNPIKPGMTDRFVKPIKPGMTARYVEPIKPGMTSGF